MDANERQFGLLTRRILDGVATDEERDELARRAKLHPKLISGVIDELVVDAVLKWHSGNLSEERPLSSAASDEFEVSRASMAGLLTRPWIWAVAAALFVATGWMAWQFSGRNPGSDLAIADIVHQEGVTWAEGSTALADDSAVKLGRLASTSGEYTLQFRSGPTVRVAGAASMDIKSKMLVQLYQGQATANVPESSIGFTIASQLVNVIDQGTQFGISVGDGRADVIVFDGKVDLQSNVGTVGSQTRLTRGEGVQVNRHGSIGRLVDVRRDVHGRWWTDSDAGADNRVIARVTDNISPNDSGKYVCYQTTYRGLEEDALAYSDSPHHQWNGLTSDGLPEFLQGADYIKTFNDYRYFLEFEMKVELARPANLYVFADNRVEPPDWLVANFEDTGVDIGLDEGPWLGQVDEKNRKWDTHTTAAGGGNSIDNTFSVWRRRCVNGGTVSLGNAGDWGADAVGVSGYGGRAMYGIAATPLDVIDSPVTTQIPEGT